jgi:hypothetical protein
MIYRRSSQSQCSNELEGTRHEQRYERRVQESGEGGVDLWTFKCPEGSPFTIGVNTMDPKWLETNAAVSSGPLIDDGGLN